MRVTLPDGPSWSAAADCGPTTWIYGSVTTFGPEEQPRKKRKKKDGPKAPLGFQPPKTKRP